MVGVLAAVALLALGSAANATPAQPQKPALRIVVKDPLTLRGERFGRLELVRVEVQQGDSQAVKKVRANRRGVFSVAFPGFALDGRSDVTVEARGARGHRAGFTINHIDRSSV